MTQPGSIGAQIPWRDESDMARALSDLRRRIEQLESNALGTNGIVVSGPPGITVKDGAGIVVDDSGVIRSGDFNGNIDTLTAGTAGWALGGLLNGAVLNQLALPNGIIGNDALTSPTTAATNKSFTTVPFGTTSRANVASVTLTVPAGFTKVIMFVHIDANGINPGGASDNLWSRVDIPGIGSSPDTLMGVAPGLSVSSTNMAAGFATVTPGSTITANGQAWTTVAPWNTGNETVYMLTWGIFTR